MSDFWDAKEWLAAKMEEHPHKDPHVIVINELLRIVLDGLPADDVEAARRVWDERVRRGWVVRREREDEARAWDRASASIHWGGQGGG